ncbi:hypothetical protein ACI7YQ_19570 (plasmid) [Alteromonas marina]|uniref:hypothetical protein n=1 Tax=unclassified Alteromonas TaxID=2614992 RepID=UPI0012E5F9BE|nr:hypothetical protein [Alteromonas sp. KUL150]GFD86890.1 hypothetical protein KUL150_29490 [Alteromonas sp. KUL150]
MKWSREKLMLPLLIACIGMVVITLCFIPNNIQQAVDPVRPAVSLGPVHDSNTDLGKGIGPKHVSLTAQTEQSDDTTILENLYQLIESNPRQAAVLLDSMKLTSKGALTLSLVKNWSLTEPENAFNWYQTQKEVLSESEYETGMRALLLRYAKHSPQKVFYDLQEYISAEHHSEVIVAVADGWANNDPEQSIVWLREIAALGSVPKTTIDDAYAKIMSHYLNHAPNLAFIVLMESEGIFNTEQIVPELAVKQAEEDLTTTIDWLAATQPVHVQNTSYIAMANARVEKDPEGAFRLLTEVREVIANNEQSFTEAVVRLVKRADHWIWSNFREIPLHMHYAASAALAERALSGKLPLEEYRLWLINSPSKQALEGGEEAINNYQETESLNEP